jgi:opacity protein-like surface antigen
MKKFIIITGVILFTNIVCAFGQEKEAKTEKVKQNQSDLFNDIYVSYGTGTLYYFVDIDDYKANSMSGTFLVGFSRSINSVIAVGFQFSYTFMDRSKEDYDYGTYPPYQGFTDYMSDNMWQGMANVRFHYLNTPGFTMYSGVGLGVTMDYYVKSTSLSADHTKGQKLLPAGQLTLLGFRVGHALSFFGEFGLGTNSILNAGISYKFKD